MRALSLLPVVAVLFGAPYIASSADAQKAQQSPNQAQEEEVLNMQASGTFEVKMTSQTTDAGDPIGRMSLDKQFHGDLEAVSKGEMLTAMTSVSGSAGYVALERVTGTLHGRAGTFVLQHSGTMAGGNQQLTISVVPDSGSDELTGLAGSMEILIEKGSHSYRFDYTISNPEL